MMTIKLPKWFTLYNFVLASFLLFVALGFVMMGLNVEVSRKLFDFGSATFVTLTYLEVRNLKESNERRLADLIRVAEISARAAYKLKQRGGSVTVNGHRL